MCHLFPKDDPECIFCTFQQGLFDSYMEAYREFEVHVAFSIQLLTGLCFNLPPATAFSTSCFQDMSAPADKLVPTNLS